MTTSDAPSDGADAEAVGAAADPATTTTATPPSSSSSSSAASVVSDFYAALSRRDLAALRILLHAECEYENLAVAGTSGAAALRGRDAVAGFFSDALSGVERGAAFEVDEWVVGGDAREEGSTLSSAAAVWRLVVTPAAANATTTTTLARGVSFFRLSGDGTVARVVDAPEHAVKTPRAGLAVAAPLAPAVQALSESLASSLDALAAAAFGGAAGAGGNSSSNGNSSSAGAAAAAAASAAVSAAAAAAWGAAAAAQQPSSSSSSSSWGEPPAAAPASAGPSSSSSSSSSEDPSAPPPAPPPPPPPPLDPRSALAGLWQRDPVRTDMLSLDASLELLRLGRLQRLTARLIDGLQVEVASAAGQQQQQMTVAFLTSVPVFRVTERVPLLPEAAQDEEEDPERWWSAELASPRAARLSRRDLRPGRAAAVARRLRPGRSSRSEEVPVLEVRTQWQAPVAGSLRETYSVVVAAGAAAGSSEGGGGDALPSPAAAAAAAATELIVTAVTEVGGRTVTSRAVYVRARAGATVDELLREGRERSGGSVAEAFRRQGL